MNTLLSPIRRVLLASAFALAAGGALAQATLPDGPLRLIIPTTPGSTPDVLARGIGMKFAERLGRIALVENKVGASGAIGTEFVVRAAPNGATLLIAASTLATGATLQQLPFDPVRDLTPIALIGWTRMVLVTHPKTGFKTAGDLVAAARKQPGRLNYGTPGVGTPNHLLGELFKVRTGTFITHIPYRGSGPQLTDVLGGQIDMAPLTVLAAAPHIRAGRLVALAVAGDKRSPLLPTVPTLADAGIKGVNGDIWYGLFGPKGMAPELVAKLNAELREVLKAEEKALGAAGIEVETGSPEQFRQLMVKDSARWADLIKSQGIKAD